MHAVHEQRCDHVCPLCGGAFGYPSVLVTHRRDVHGETVVAQQQEQQQEQQEQQQQQRQ